MRIGGVRRRGDGGERARSGGRGGAVRGAAAVLAPVHVGRRAGRSAGRRDAPRRAAGDRPARRRGPRVQGPVRPSRHGAVAGLGRGRAPGVCVPRLDVRPGRRLHPDPRQPRDEHPEQGADRRLPRGRARRPDLGLPRRRRARDAAARLPRVGRRRVSEDQDPAVRLALQRGATGRELRRLQPLRVGPRGHPRRPVEAGDPGPRRRPGRDDAVVRARDRGAREPRQGRCRRRRADPADAQPVHDLDALLGPPRPAARGRPPLRAVRRVVPAVGQGDPQLHLERAQLRARPGRATRASSTSSR